MKQVIITEMYSLAIKVNTLLSVLYITHQFATFFFIKQQHTVLFFKQLLNPFTPTHVNKAPMVKEHTVQPETAC